MEQVGSDALEPAMCADVDRAAAAATLAFDGPAAMAPEDVKESYRETELTGSRRIDIANDGQPVQVGSFEMTSSAGAGCGETFFDELDATATQFRRGPDRDRLMALQGVEPGGRYPLKCANAPRFFTWRGMVYFENKPVAWPPVDAWNSYHRIARIRPHAPKS